MAGEVVEDNDITRLERRRQLGLDIDLEGLPVHGAVDDPRRGQAVAAQGGDEGLRPPVSEWRAGLEPLSSPGPPAQPGHLGRRGGLIDERQPVWFLAHPGLAVAPPDPALHHHIIATGLGCQQRFF